MKSEKVRNKTYNVTILKLFEAILSLGREQQEELLGLVQKMTGGENRKARRRECTIPINYLVNDHLHTDLIKNISRTGVYVETSKPVPVGARTVMSFSLPSFHKPLKVEGRIIWCDLQGFGAVFTSLTRYQEEMLALIIERMERPAE